MSTLYSEKFRVNDSEDWLVLLHGFGGNINMWLRQKAFLKRKYNIILIDLPGHGKSKGIVDVSRNSLKSMYDIGDIVVETLKSEGIYKATFLCLSLGTLVFAGICTKHPEIVNGAILCGAVAGLNIVFDRIVVGMSKVYKILPHKMIMPICAYVLLPKRNQKVARDFFISTSKDMDVVEFDTWIKLIVKDRDILKNLDATNNILFVSGSEDYTFLTGVKKTVNRLHNAGLQLLSGCGHVCNIQKSKEFNKLVYDYLYNNRKEV